MYDGVNLGNTQAPRELRVWPKPITTDAQGRFRLNGIGSDLTVGLSVRDRRFADQWLTIKTDGRDAPKEITLALQPATIVAGRVVGADSSQPMPGALVEVSSSQDPMLLSGSRFRADDQGRFTANVAPGRYYRIQAFPPEGQPYLISEQEFEWTKGAVKKVVDVMVARGVLIQGKVTEQGTGRALAGASVQYISRNPRGNPSGWSDTVVASNDSGAFRIAVPPGKGYLFVFGPTSDYTLEAIGSRIVELGQPGGERYYAHRIISYEVKAGDGPHEIDAALRPGKTIKGRVVGPEDQTVDHATIITTLHIEHFHLVWRGDLTLHARDGRFELHGLDPEKPARVWFLDSDHEWGATAEISARQAGEEVTIRLQPCGKARARLVGPDGKPVVRVFPHFELVGTPGLSKGDRHKDSQASLAADAAYLPNLDRQHYWKAPLTDLDGRITLPDLVPGALYRISDYSTVNVPDTGVQVRKDFTVKPGETLELGDILVEKPRS
jgi:hypothetical protein